MKRNVTHQSAGSRDRAATFIIACLAVCRNVGERIARAGKMISHATRGALRVQERLLRLALNEAKAVAWRTAYPDLVFPVRATQQVQAVVGRDAKLQTLWRARYALWSGDPGKNRSHQQPRTEL